jgi:hypothetical protein
MQLKKAALSNLSIEDSGKDAKSSGPIKTGFVVDLWVSINLSINLHQGSVTRSAQYLKLHKCSYPQ